MYLWAGNVVKEYVNLLVKVSEEGSEEEFCTGYIKGEEPEVEMKGWINDDRRQRFIPIFKDREKFKEQVEELYVNNLVSPDKREREETELFMKLFVKNLYHNPYEAVEEYFENQFTIDKDGIRLTDSFYPKHEAPPVEDYVEFIEDQKVKEEIVSGDVYRATNAASGTARLRFKIKKTFYQLEFSRVDLGYARGEYGSIHSELFENDGIHMFLEDPESWKELSRIVNTEIDTINKPPSNLSEIWQSVSTKKEPIGSIALMLEFTHEWCRSGGYEYPTEWDCETHLSGVVDPKTIRLMGDDAALIKTALEKLYNEGIDTLVSDLAENLDRNPKLKEAINLARKALGFEEPIEEDGFIKFLKEQ